MTSTRNKVFIDKFNFDKYGFYDPVSYVDGNIGFTVKKKLRDDLSKNISLLKIAIFKENYENINIKKKPVRIRAFYGEMDDIGLSIRDAKQIKFTDPFDVEYPNEYFYDVEANQLYKKKKKITADNLLNRVYDKHIKSTKPIIGLPLRARIFLWRVILKWSFAVEAEVISWFLYCISGVRYSYKPIFKEERINDQRIEFEFRKEEIKKMLKAGRKFNFFGYEAKYWSVIFYSWFHFLAYLFFHFRNYKPTLITTIFANNFLVLLYVILSLWVIEEAIPRFLMFLIKKFSRLSFWSSYRSIRL